MKFHLNAHQMDIVTRQKILMLEKENKSLARKLITANKKLRNFQKHMDLTVETRKEIRDLAESLVYKLQDANFTNFQIDNE